jgi:hypothetical protein
MFLRRTKARSNGKVYEYVHLAESYRRPSDGRPTHRILGNLGDLDDVTFANLQAALEASREGRRVVVAKPLASKKPPPKPSACLQYLDVAVALEMWRKFGLAELVSELMPIGEAEVGDGDVLAALVLHRCLHPSSKLEATRWLPSTALPELLRIDAAKLNNTRIHRVLDAIDAATPAIMGRLPSLYAEQQVAFGAFFLDVTDTWFVGTGPALAERAKTKEGVVARKIGIVMLCNQHGFPIRWEVVRGRRYESGAMLDVMSSISRLAWAQGVPIVIDRGMGRTAHVHQMQGTGLRFVTALTVAEFDTYGAGLPTLPSFAESSRDDVWAAGAARGAAEAGFERVADNLYVVDLGIVERVVDPVPRTTTGDDATAYAMRCCRDMLAAVAEKRVRSPLGAAAALGLKKGLAAKYLRLKKLSPAIQAEILEGAARGCSLASLIEIACEADPDKQSRAFRALVDNSPGVSRPVAIATPAGEFAVETKPLRVRVVAYFNPERFVSQRRLAARKLKAVAEFEAELNKQLASPRTKRSRENIVAEVDRRLRRDDLLEAYEIKIEETAESARNRYRVRLVLNEANWAKRRRYDGFSVLVADPGIEAPAAAIAGLYRSRDKIEKGFQAIKSVLELRPIRHRTDPKVRAHVTLCMLALILERAIETAARGHTATDVFATLEPCRLAKYIDADANALYVLTELSAAQRSVIRALRMDGLTDDNQIAARIEAR